MEENLKLSTPARTLVLIVIIVHLMFFILEALFWMRPEIYKILLGLLDNQVDLSYPVQALTLKRLFINQGCYNLFLAIGGLYGLRLARSGRYIAGYTLILFLCFCGIGAGLVLAGSTIAYILAIGQAVPALAALAMVLPYFKLASRFEQS